MLIDGDQIFVTHAGEVTAFGLNGEVRWHNPLKGRGSGAIALGFPGHLRQVDHGRG